MAPSAGGHILVSKSLRLLRLGFEKAARVVRDKLPQATQPIESQGQPVYARVATQPVNRIAAIRQGQNRWYTTKTRIEHTVRRFYSTTNPTSKPLRSSYPPSRTGRAVSQLTSRAPFASTLRPNLTGGTLSRSAGGYNTGAGRVNGVRYFSHTPAAPAEVIQNVSQAVRAFWLSGQKAHFNGHNPKTGEKRFRAVSSHQDRVQHKLGVSSVNAPGAFLDFKVSPTITAIGPLSKIPLCESSSSCEFDEEDSVTAAAAEHATIADSTLITTLEVDFARALKDLAAIMNDLKHLSALGSLPITLVNPTTLRVRFPGCDADTVESLCRELNIRRGMVGQDPEFDAHVGAEMALLFPFAPSRTQSKTGSDFLVPEEDDHHHRRIKRSKRDNVEWTHMLSPAVMSRNMSSPTDLSSFGTNQDGHMPFLDVDDQDAEILVDNPWLSDALSNYSSLHAASAEEDGDVAGMFFQPPSANRQFPSQSDSPASKYEGLEGIYRFIGECEKARRLEGMGWGRS